MRDRLFSRVIFSKMMKAILIVKGAIKGCCLSSLVVLWCTVVHTKLGCWLGKGVFDVHCEVKSNSK